MLSIAQTLRHISKVLKDPHAPGRKLYVPDIHGWLPTKHITPKKGPGSYKREKRVTIGVSELGTITKCLNFPIIRQTNCNSCGASSLQALLFFYGIDEMESDLMKELGTRETGTQNEAIIKALEKRGFKVEYGENYSVQDIINFIDRDLPCILNVQAWPDKKITDWSNTWKNGHNVTAIGYTPQSIIFSDPSCINKVFLSFKELEERWHDINNKKVYHTAIIPTGKHSQYDSNKIIHMQ